MRSLVALLLLVQLAAPLQETAEAPYTDSTLLSLEKVKSWAAEIAAQLEAYERRALDRERLASSLSGSAEARDGAALVGEVARKMAAVAASRAAAAEGIARAAERHAHEAAPPPPADYTFLPSVELDRYKVSYWNELDNNNPWKKNHTCRSYGPHHLEYSTQFEARITRNNGSVHVPVETFDCDDRVLPAIHRSEKLEYEFQRNYANDATFSWQYYCSASGFLRHYPGAAWSSMAGAAEGQNDEDDEEKGDKEPDLYDCRMRTWYVEATGAPRDVLILLDATGSITQLKRLIAIELVRELLTALTDDDHVNVLRFNRKLGVKSPIPCFENMLVPANHVNVAAMLHNLTDFITKNNTHLPDVLRTAVELLNASRHRSDSTFGCQQALVLIADDVPENLTEVMRQLEPEGRVRVFVFMMGIGKMSTEYAENLACDNDGYFAQLEGPADVTEQVRRVLRVLERPAVLNHQRHPTSASHRYPPVWSDLYAHIQDPRFGHFRWRKKEKAEQKRRYMRLRRNKTIFMSPEQLDRDFQTNQYSTTLGHYSEEDKVPYQLMITVAVPAYDPVERENVTVLLMEERQRNSTREERVARLLGVAGVDIPIQDLRLQLPYYKLGPGGSLFIIDHRGNTILHDDLRPVVEDNILKPGYRTVDLLDAELPDDDLLPRNYSQELVQFREAIMKEEKGSAALQVKVPYDGRLRMETGLRRYFWRRVQGTTYTAVVSLPVPAPSASLPPTAERHLSSSTAALAHSALNETEASVQPDWLYCRYLERQFERPIQEVLHFLQRIAEEPDFSYKQLRYSIHRLPPGLLDMPYICEKELMSRLAWEARATEWFATEGDERFAEWEGVRGAECVLGSSTAFVATPSGLTRWRHRVVPGDKELIRPETEDARGPVAAWYRRAAGAAGALVVHAPLARARPLLTAARALRPPAPAPPRAADLGVAGFHFRASHLVALMDSITVTPCKGAEGGEGECEPSCGSDSWHCLLVDEAGWVLAERGAPIAPRHLAAAHQPAMRRLTEAGVFRLSWLHDYQAVCFPPKKGKPCSAPRPAPPGARVWRWFTDVLSCLVPRAHHALQALTLLATAGGSAADTQVERQKRKVRVRKDYDREEWEKLFDKRVCINLTFPATCDRRRALYSLQSDADARLAKQRVSCEKWPLVAVPVPRTNLLLIALYTLCPESGSGEHLDDPTDNLEVVPKVEPKQPPIEPPEPLESRLACMRHSTRAMLTARRPVDVCHEHSRAQEFEFRQCGARIADVDEMTAGAATTTACITLLLYCLALMTT